MCNECETPEEDITCPKTLEILHEYTEIEIFRVIGMTEQILQYYYTKTLN